MKKVLILFLALSVTGITFGQEKELIFKKNELSLNLPTTIFASFPEITYERILAEDFSIGASAGFSLKGKDNDNFANTKFLFSPYARWYFGGSTESMQKYAAGFFIEANCALVSAEKNVVFSTAIGSPVGSKARKEADTYVGFGLGVAVGWKYVTKNDWVGQIYMGLGKIFSESEAYPRVGITIGKRF